MILKKIQVKEIPLKKRGSVEESFIISQFKLV